MSLDLAQLIPGKQAAPEAAGRARECGPHATSAGARQRQEVCRDSAFEKEMARSVAEQKHGSEPQEGRESVAGPETQDRSAENRAEPDEALRISQDEAALVLTAEIDGQLPCGRDSGEGAVPAGADENALPESVQEDISVPLRHGRPTGKRHGHQGVPPGPFPSPARVAGGETVQDPASGVLPVNEDPEPGVEKGQGVSPTQTDAAHDVPAGKAEGIGVPGRAEAVRVLASGDYETLRDFDVRGERATGEDYTKEAPSPRILPGGQGEASRGAGTRQQDVPPSPGLQPSVQSPETSRSPAEDGPRLPGTPDRPSPQQGSEKGNEAAALQRQGHADVRGDRQQVSPTPPDPALKGGGDGGGQQRAQGTAGGAAQALAGQTNQPGEEGAFRGDQGPDRREPSWVRQDSGAPQTAAARESQPLFEAQHAELRNGDSVSQAAAGTDPAGKVSPFSEQGQHAESSVRNPHPGSAGSGDARGFDPTHLEAKANFDASGKTVHLKIQDQGLGTMHWHLRMESGRVAAEAVVQSARVQELVHSHQHALQARLSEVGVRMEGFSVSVDQGSHGFFGHEQQRHTAPTADGHDPVPSASFVEPGPARNRPSAYGGRLDLFA